MTIHFVGSEIPGFMPSASNVTEDSTNANPFGRIGMHATNTSNYALIDDLPDLDDLWLHGFFELRTASQAILFKDNGGNIVFRMQSSAVSQTYTFQSCTAGVFTTLGSFSIGTDTVQEIDIHWKADASGSLNVYIAGTNRLSTSADYSAFDNIAQIEIHGGSSSGSATTYFYGVVVADESTIAWRLATDYPTGAGATQAWASGYATIDEATHNDADYIASDTANQVSTFTHTGPSLTGYTVRAVVVSARAKRGAAGPANLQLALRSGGTDYFSSSKALDVGYETKFNVWDTNPDTAVAFLASEIAALQPGVKSIT